MFLPWYLNDVYFAGLGFQHFNETEANDYWVGYREDRHPYPMMFVSLNGQLVTEQTRSLLNHLDLEFFLMNLYQPHRQTCDRFWIILDSWDMDLAGSDICWSGCCASLVTSKPSSSIYEKVQIPRRSSMWAASATCMILIICWLYNLGLLAPTGLETKAIYMRWNSAISHPYIISQHEHSHIPRPPEPEAIDEVVVEEHDVQ